MRQRVDLFIPLILALSVSAQESEDDEPAALETITVTGSRLERIDYETPQPVVVFTRDELLAEGYGTLADFANKLVYTYGPSDGLSTIERIDLRDIGGTLILVNGRRLARFPTDDFQDVSAIPIWAIERIEILKDGASALYGSDAITGVVNIILRKNYDGAEVSLKYQAPTNGSSDEMQFGATFGSGDGRFNWMASLTAFDRDEDLIAALEDRSEFFERSGISEIFTVLAGNPGTYIDPETLDVFPDPECPASQLGYLSPRTDRFGQPTCVTRLMTLRSAETETTRYGAHASMDYELDSGLVVDGEILISRREGRLTDVPFPVRIFNNESTFARPIVPANHPANPFGRQVEAFLLPLDLGLTMNEDISELARYRLGLNGQSAILDWQSSVSFEQNKLENANLNIVDTDRLQAALNGEGGPSANQFYNPFGLSPGNPADLIDWLTTDRTEPAHSESHLWLADLIVRGDAFELPAGKLQYVAGLEYQDLAIENPTIDESRDILAGFLEFGVPASKQLEMQLAVRTEHYSDFGTTTNPKLSARWQPHDKWMFRGSWSTSFRAPSLESLFRVTPRQSFFAPISDPIRCPVTADIQDCGEAAPTELIRRGNPNLEPEDGESLHISAMWQPTERLSTELSLWEFDYTGQVVNVPRFILLQFADDPNFFIREEPTADDIALGLPGRLIAVVDQPVNGDNVRTRGADLEIHYDLPLGNHDLRFRWATSYQDEQQRIRFGFEQFGPGEDAGQFKPDLQSRFDAHWSSGHHEVSGTIYYQNSFIYRAFSVDGEDLPVEVDAFTVLDLQYRFTWSRWNTDFRIGCKNCLDNAPPFSAEPGGLDYNHDGRGTILYAQVDWRFGR